MIICRSQQKNDNYKPQQKKYNCDNQKKDKMRIVVQLIENYLKQEVPAILITTDNNKYLFNVPSSYQRFTKEHKSKFPGGGRFFFTKTNTSAITGLTGLMLTMASHGAASGIKLYADEKMFRYMEELRYKMGFKALPLSYCSWEGKLRKGVLDISFLQGISKLQNFNVIFDKFHQYIEENVPPKQQNNAFDFFNNKNTQFKDQDLQILPFFIQEGKELITNYIIIPGVLPGKFIPQKLKQYGIPNKMVGNMISQGFLQINQKIVKVQDVTDKDTPSPNVILLHYSQKQTIAKILQNSRFADFINNKLNIIHSVVHIVEDSEIINSVEFKELLSVFAKDTQHVVYNNKIRNSSDKIDDLVRLSASVRLVSDLHKFFPLCMPNLYAKHQQYVKEYLGKTEAIDLLFPQFKVQAYKRCHELILAPKKSWGYKVITAGSKKQKDILKDIQVPKIDAQLEPNFKELFKKINPKVIFLGTGSMKPSKYRNVSSIMVQWLPHLNMMFDCGQGSHIQLIDHYGYEQYPQVIINLRVIFITHIHSDHNLGLLDLISQRTKMMKSKNMDPSKDKLFLILPANVVPWYNSFCQNVEDLNQGCSVIFIQALRNEDYSFQGTMSKEAALNRVCSSKSDMVDEADEGEDAQEDQLSFIRPEWNEILRQYFEHQQYSLKEFQQMLQKAGITSFYPCPVIHCPQSYGICIKHESGYKLSYSGDTRPCVEFADAAKDSTLLIHEATFGDDLQRNAFDHFHSTVGEAMEIAMKSNSWKLALTHFSQRYKSAQDIVDPRNYLLNKLKRNYAEKHTIVCFDHLQIEMDKAHVMPAYSRAIAAAIPKESNRE